MEDGAAPAAPTAPAAPEADLAVATEAELAAVTELVAVSVATEPAVVPVAWTPAAGWAKHDAAVASLAKDAEAVVTGAAKDAKESLAAGWAKHDAAMASLAKDAETAAAVAAKDATASAVRSYAGFLESPRGRALIDALRTEFESGALALAAPLAFARVPRPDPLNARH